MCKWLGEFQKTIAPRQIKYYYPFGWFFTSGKARAGLNDLKITRNFAQQDVDLRRDEADGASSSPPVPGASAKIRAGPPRCGMVMQYPSRWVHLDPVLGPQPSGRFSVQTGEGRPIDLRDCEW